MNDFDYVSSRRNTYCAKHDSFDKVYGRKDLIHLGVADTDFTTAKEIVKKLEEVATFGLFGYTDTNEDFYNAIIHHLNNRYNSHVSQEEILYCSRINIAEVASIMALTQPNDQVLINTPAYTPLHNAITQNQRRVIESPMVRVDNGYQIDFDHMESVVTSDTKIYVLCSPYNPTGTVFSREVLEHVGDFCIKHDLILFCDEIHGDIIKEGVAFTSVLTLSDKLLDRLIYANSPAKTFNTPGLITAYLVIPNKDIREKVGRSINDMGIHNPNIFGLNALITGYESCDDYIDELNVYIDDNERFVREYLQANMDGFKVMDREGTFLLWIDYSSLDVTEEILKDWIINKANVSVYFSS